MRTPDADVDKLLRLFTFLPIKEIEAVVKDHMVSFRCSPEWATLTFLQAKPHLRTAQKLLANEITQLVHGRKSGIFRLVRGA